MILLEALNLGMPALTQVQFANIQSQYTLDSSIESDDNDNAEEKDDREEPPAQGAADADEGDDEDIDDTCNFIMQRYDAGDNDSETIGDNAPTKKCKVEKRSKKKNDST
ncbi:hypothetical protein ACH5RR_034043 [Cinchona calisaya]|uniref:Uncharacterized protein n=1 Tax=Cinchona calisaya TaxID=153742 RepID=A0ABD2YCR2_9GENT